MTRIARMRSRGRCAGWLVDALEYERLIVQRVSDANRDVTGEQVIDDLADDCRPPARGQEGHFARTETAELQAIGDEVTNVLGRAGQARGHLSATADAAQGRAEKLAEQVELRPRAFLG